MLQRSKGAGLMVNLGQTLDDKLISAIFNHTVRITELTVNDGKRLQALIEKGLLSSAPKLEKLCLKNEYYGLGEKPPNPVLLGTMFPDTVGLRHLELIGVDPVWNSPLFSRPITTLELGQISPSKKPTVQELKSVMGQISTTLETLTMRNAFPEDATASPTQNAASISLNSLRHLALGAKPVNVTTFFNNFTLTDKAKYAGMLVFLDNGPGQDFTQFLEAIGHKEALGRIASDAIGVMIDGEIHGTKKGKKWQDFEVSLGTAQVSWSTVADAPPRDEDDLESKLPGLELFIRSPLPESPSVAALPFRCIFTDLFNTFEWSNLRELTLVGLDIKAFPDFDRALATTFGALPSVDFVAVGPKCANPLFDALNYSSATNRSSRSKAAMSFAGLKRISLVSVNIQSRVDDMAGSLSKRHKRGASIKNLSFEGCRGKTNKSLKLLKEYVGNVFWDYVKL
ncbi:hypothetical protein D9619_003544 [Psilocybe cf. subviscida]|uniref:Uncharacterized protein n=1 Tax=Psilocybe cf. subviscida TaxID=2480587 RepID=A0A8H5ETX5_9AGAR|nr:hypothetical protein D9619_003544 [Psilocybe cf. subviscida]